MTKTKSTKRALLMSALALLMCVSMLIGSTYAWFSDTASTGVNTIQAGTLDIVLEYKDADGNWQNAEGKTLDFKDLDSNTYWEPGCTYELPAVRVRNNGNLALKYQIVINGVTGNAKLLEAIEFTANGNAISSFGGHLDTKDATSEEIVIKGHMKEEAGNEYQGLTLDGIGITVYATQYTYEKDSYSDKYDLIGDDIYPNGTFRYNCINSGRIMGNSSRYQIAADITKVSGVKTLAVNVLDQNGKLMTTITPEGYQIPADGKISSATVSAVVIGDSSSWQNTAFVPSMSAIPTTMELVVNGAVIGVTDVKPYQNVTWAEIVNAYYVANNVTVIDTAEDLVALGGTDINGTYALMADLDMTGKAMESMVVRGGASVNFIGNGHTISNLALAAAGNFGMTGASEVAGLFDLSAPSSSAVSLTVSDLTIKNAEVACTGYAAAIVGYTSNGKSVITLNNVDVDGAKVEAATVAALVGYTVGEVNLNGCDVSNLTLTGEKTEKMGAYVGTANTADCVVTVDGCTNGTTYNNYGRVINGATAN